MKIVVTGSLGRISKPLTQKLIQNGHSVTVISSQPDRQKDIEALGANAAIGMIQNIRFLTETFTGADLVYLMEPPIDYFNHNPDPKSSWIHISNCYVQAIEQSGVTKVIHLSSIGAHTDEGVGMLATHHKVENILKTLSDNVYIKFMRPVGFYYNMFGFIPTIKTQRSIIQNYGGDEKEPWVSPLDIASVIAEEMEMPFTERSVRYIASDEISPNEVATVLGEAIGLHDLKWETIADDQFLNSLLAAGLNPDRAKGLTEMNAGRRKNLYGDYDLNRPILGKVKLSDFAKEFAKIYHQQ